MKISILIFVVFISLTTKAIVVNKISDINGNESAITEIDLSNKGLLDFPDVILKCTNLKKLNLSRNGFVEIPKELGNLEHLKILNLSNNPSINTMSLVYLMNDAKFNLTELYLNNCHLSMLPDGISNQKNLKIFEANHNKLCSIPMGMMNLGKLQKVDLSHNQLNDVSWIINYWWAIQDVDFSENKSMQTTPALSSLAYYDYLNKITISHLSEMPENFEILNVNQLTIKNSTINKWNRSGLSSQIKTIHFENCTFTGLGQIVSAMNDYKGPDKLILSNMLASEIKNFSLVEVDSLILYEIPGLSILPLTKSKKLKYLDIRICKIPKTEIEAFQQENPNVTILYKENVPNKVGINVPIQKYIQTPTVKTINTSNDNLINLGQSLIEIPAGSLVDKNGNAVNGEVKLSYVEYMNPVEIMLSGIPMTMEENGETMLFSSGGMFDLNATDNSGNEVFINPETPLSVQLITPTDNENMKLYQLNKNGVWEDRGTNDIVKPFEFDQSKLDSIMNLDFESIYYNQIQLITDRYVPVVKKDKKLKTFKLSLKYYPKANSVTRKDQFRFNRYYARDYIAKFINEHTLIFEGDSVEYYYNFLDSLAKSADKKYEYLKVRKTNTYSVIGPNYFYDYEILPDYENDRFKLNFKYKDTTIQVPFNLVPKGTANKMINESRIFFKKYARNWKSNKNARQKIDNMIDKRKLMSIEQLKAQAIEKEKIRQEMMMENKEYMESLAGGGSMMRAFQINSFGTWNCDVRQRMANPHVLNTDFVNEDNEPVKADDKNVIIVDQDANSAIQFDFGRDAFFDTANRNIIVVFISATLVGIYHSIQDLINDGPRKLQILDISNMSKATFANYLINEE